MFDNDMEHKVEQYLMNAYDYNSAEFDEFHELSFEPLCCSKEKHKSLTPTLECAEKRLQSMLIAEVVSTAAITPRAIACAECLQQIRIAVAQVTDTDTIPALALLFVAISFDLEWAYGRKNEPQSRPPAASTPPQIICDCSMDDLPF